MTKLTEKTLIPLGLALSAIGGGAAWLTTLHVTTSANAASLQKMTDKQDAYSDAILRIERDISEIKGELKRIKR